MYLYISYTIQQGGMVFNATFNNIAAISWQSVLLMEETGAPKKNHQPAANHWVMIVKY